MADGEGTVRVQVNMQRRKNFEPVLRRGVGVVEVQRTRTGTRQGVATRPYRFGEFDVLAVYMEPSHGRWNSFLYVPGRWLLPRVENKELVMILQPLSLQPDDIWTDDFDEVVRRMRAGENRPGATA